MSHASLVLSPSASSSITNSPPPQRDTNFSDWLALKNSSLSHQKSCWPPSPSRSLSPAAENRSALCSLPAYENSLSSPSASSLHVLDDKPLSNSYPSLLLPSSQLLLSPPTFIKDLETNPFSQNIDLPQDWIQSSDVSPIIRATSQDRSAKSERFSTTSHGNSPTFLQKLQRHSASTDRRQMDEQRDQTPSAALFEGPTTTLSRDTGSSSSATSTTMPLTPVSRNTRSQRLLASPLTPMSSPEPHYPMTRSVARKRKLATTSISPPAVRSKRPRSAAVELSTSLEASPAAQFTRRSERHREVQRPSNRTGHPQYTMRSQPTSRAIDISPEFKLFYRRFPASSYYQPPDAAWVRTFSRPITF